MRKHIFTIIIALFSLCASQTLSASDQSLESDTYERNFDKYLSDETKIWGIATALLLGAAPDLNMIPETQLIKFVTKESPLIMEVLRYTGRPLTDFANTLKEKALYHFLGKSKK